MPIFVNEVHAEVIPPELGADEDTSLVPSEPAEFELLEKLALLQERAERLVVD